MGFKLARLLAPIALIAVAAGTYLVVHSSLAVHHPAPVAQSRTLQRGRRKAHARLAEPKFYIVRSGDSLSAIAAKSGISQATLQALNPSVSPDSLQTGQRLRLRR
jgi:LysM repeat protein